MQESRGGESSCSEFTDYSESSDDDAPHPVVGGAAEVGAVRLNRFFDEVVEPLETASVPERVAGSVRRAGMLEADV